nr:MAG TPA: hypothetical protein [Caudoviricetes sp.]
MQYAALNAEKISIPIRLELPPLPKPSDVKWRISFMWTSRSRAHKGFTCNP